MLTYEQAVHFLESHLRMPTGWRELLQDNPLEFLSLYIRRHAVRIPFQNIEMVAVDQDKRRFPSESDLINVGLAGRGGCCIHLNYFSKLVLQAIGLDSFVVRGDLYSAMTAGTHCLLLVKLYSPAEQAGTYMVEVGDPYPLLEPISMDKEKLPFKILQAAGFPYEYREFAPGWIGKFHLNGGLMGGQYPEGTKEKLRASWDRKPRGLWEFDYPMMETFTNPAASGILKHPSMYRYFTNTEFRKLFPEFPESVKLQNESYKFSNVVVNGRMGQCSLDDSPANREDNKLCGLTESKCEKPLAATEEQRNCKAKKSEVSSQIDTSSSVTKLNLPSVSFTKPVLTNDHRLEETKLAAEEVVSDNDDDFEPPKNFIVVWKRRIVVGDAQSRKIVKNFSSYEEMAPELKKYFPKVPTSAMEKAIATFSKFEPIPNAQDLIL